MRWGTSPAWTPAREEPVPTTAPPGGALDHDGRCRPERDAVPCDVEHAACAIRLAIPADAQEPTAVRRHGDRQFIAEVDRICPGGFQRHWYRSEERRVGKECRSR